MRNFAREEIHRAVNATRLASAEKRSAMHVGSNPLSPTTHSLEFAIFSAFTKMPLISGTCADTVQEETDRERENLSPPAT